MKKFFTLIILLFSVYSNAQVLCGTTDEGGTIILTAPAGNVFTTIDFASYGTPNGSCGSFTIGSCHAVNSTIICSAAFVGMNSASINATNGVFGDPCGGTFKRLYIQATYSSILPLTLISFTAKKIEVGKVSLDWLSNNEINTSHFVIERSTNGFLFEPAGSVPATGIGGYSYSFTSMILSTVPTYYYRLKMVDADDHFIYSKIILVKNGAAKQDLWVVNNPFEAFIKLRLAKQSQQKIKIELINAVGNKLFYKEFGARSLITIDLSSMQLNRGVYFLRAEVDGNVYTRKLVKN